METADASGSVSSVSELEETGFLSSAQRSAPSAAGDGIKGNKQAGGCCSSAPALISRLERRASLAAPRLTAAFVEAESLLRRHVTFFQTLITACWGRGGCRFFRRGGVVGGSNVENDSRLLEWNRLMSEPQNKTSLRGRLLS